MNRDRKNQLFRPGSLQGNVVLNFKFDPSSDFSAWAGSFRGAARVLAERLNQAGGYSDLDACPIVFLYRHAMELYLKALVLQGRQLYKQLDEPFPDVAKVLTQHRLSPLLAPIDKTFKRVGLEWDLESPAPQSFRDLRRFILDLEAVDSVSMAFRYPVEKDYQSSKLPPNFLFNVLDFAAMAEAILEGLSAAVYSLDYELEMNREWLGYIAESLPRYEEQYSGEG